jgi:hypothetical protein
LKEDKEIKMRKNINDTLDTKVPNVRRNYTKTNIRTVIREEPIKLAQYLRSKSSKFEPLFVCAAE